MTSGSLCSAAALGSPARSSSLTATLPCLCRPDPALADTLAPDPLRLSDGHHPGAAPAVAPHPDGCWTSFAARPLSEVSCTTVV